MKSTGVYKNVEDDLKEIILDMACGRLGAISSGVLLLMDDNQEVARFDLGETEQKLSALIIAMGSLGISEENNHAALITQSTDLVDAVANLIMDEDDYGKVLQ